jgi:hypothetical protein
MSTCARFVVLLAAAIAAPLGVRAHAAMEGMRA